MIAMVLGVTWEARRIPWFRGVHEFPEYPSPPHPGWFEPREGVRGLRRRSGHRLAGAREEGSCLGLGRGGLGGEYADDTRCEITDQGRTTCCVGQFSVG